MAELSNEAANNSFLSIGSAAELLGVSIDTLRRWEKKGKINVYRSPGGHRYFKKEELEGAFGTKYERTEPTIRSSQTKSPEEDSVIPPVVNQESHGPAEVRDSMVQIPQQTPIRIISAVEVQSIRVMDEPIPYIPETIIPAAPQEPEPSTPPTEEKSTSPRVIVEERIVEVTETRSEENPPAPQTESKSILDPHPGDQTLRPTEFETKTTGVMRKSHKFRNLTIIAIVFFLIFDIALTILWLMGQKLISPIP